MQVVQASLGIASSRTTHTWQKVRLQIVLVRFDNLVWKLAFGHVPKESTDGTFTIPQVLDKLWVLGKLLRRKVTGPVKARLVGSVNLLSCQHG